MGEDEEKDEKKESGEKEEKAEEKEAEEDSLEDEVKKAQDGIELTAEEKSLWFSKSETKDLSSRDFSRLFSSFTIPSKDEGFDEIRYVWQKAPACEEYLKNWILGRKLTERVEDLQPGSWFKDQFSEWNTMFSDWRKRHSDWKDPMKRKQLLEKRKRDRKQKRKEENASMETEDEKKEVTVDAEKTEKDVEMDEKKDAEDAEK